MSPSRRQRRLVLLCAASLLAIFLHDSSGASRATRAAEAAQPVEARSDGAAGSECEDARRLVAEAESLRAEWKNDSLRAAVERYTAAADCWRGAGAQREAGGALVNSGDMRFFLSEYENARKDYAEALEEFRRARDTRGEAEALHKLGLVYSYLGDTDKAVRTSEESLALSRRVGDKRLESRALDALSLAHYMRSDMERALDGFRQALAAAQSAGDRLQQAQVMLNLGYARNDAGEMEEALSYYTQALPLWEEANHRRGMSRTLTAIGGVYSALGESQQALDHHQRALRLAREMGDADSRAAIQNGLGYVYEALGDYPRALDSYASALEDFRAAGNAPGEAQTSQFVGNIYWLLGDKTKAQDFYARGLALSRKLGDPTLEALALNRIGTVAQEAGDGQQALANFERALALYRRAGNRRAEAITLNHLGGALRTLGKERAALAQHARALPLARATGDRALEVLTSTRVARLERDLGRLDAARARLESTLKLIESLRTKVVSLDLRSSYLAAVREHYELYIDTLMRTHAARPSEGFDTAALRMSELARARSFLDMMSDGHAGARLNADPALLEKDRSLRDSLDRVEARRMRLAGAGQTGDQAAALAREAAALAEEYERVGARIRETSPLYAALTRPQPPDLRVIQQEVLDDETLLLEYALADERSYLWVVSRTSVTAHSLAPRARIESAARRVYELLRACQPAPGETAAGRQARLVAIEAEYWTRAAELGEMVLGPAAGQLAGKRLLIVADGALQYVPFGALTLRSSAPAEHGTTTETSTERSATTETAVGGDSSTAVSPSASTAVSNSTTAGRGASTEVGDGASASAATSDDAPLGLEHEIVTLPSATLLWVIRKGALQREQAEGVVAILADPVFEKDDPRVRPDAAQPAAPAEQPAAEFAPALLSVTAAGGISRLMAAREEAAAIISALPAGGALEVNGFDASRARAMSPELGRYQIVHFATHGILDSEHPELSGIVLSLVDSAGRPQNGFLSLRDVYDLNLPVELVVLSACNTGLGKDVKGEGLVGLTRGFMYAGASSVMASLWKVDDDATAELMKHFYRGVLREGLPPAAALRQAQRRMWAQKRWRAPYFWAGFVLQGDYGRTIQLNEHGRGRGTSGAGLLVVIICCASAAALFVLLRLRASRAAAASSPAGGKESSGP